MTVEELVNRFDDLVTALQQIASVLEDAAVDFVRDGEGDSQ